MKRVLVRHAGKDGKSTLGKNIIQNIRHFYVSGKVRTVSGDVWNVKPVDHRDYEYVTTEQVSR